MLAVPAAFADYGPDAIRCLFPKPTLTRIEIEDNLRATWPTSQVPALWNALVSSGWITTAPSDRTRYRCQSDMPEVQWNKNEPVTLASELPASMAEHPSPPLISLFRGGIKCVKPSGTITPAELYDDLTGGRYRLRTESLRAAGRGAPEYAQLKSGLDYVTPGGVFSHRSERGLLAPSDLMVLDFDKLPDLPAARSALLNDEKIGPAVVLLFTSPSGDGLKCLLPTDTAASYLENFKGVSRYLSRKYAALGLVPDESGKDISRACFLSHDPDAYLSDYYQHLNKLAA